MQSKHTAVLLVSFLSLAGCGGGGGGGSSSAAVPVQTGPSSGSSAPAPVSPSTPVTQPAVPVANTPPVANAGTAQSVLAGAVVTADGSASSDADNNQLTYTWALTSRPANSTATLSSASSSKPTFIADIPGDYLLSLTVNDGKVDSTPSTVKVTAAVVNAAPVASAGASQNALTGTIVTLDGSGSSDANGDALSYAWTLNRPTGSTASLSDAAGAKPTFVPDVAGTYTATLSVNDGKVSSLPASTTVAVTMANVAPVANAGAAKRAVFGSTVALDGAGSRDANGDAITYSWTLTSKPAGSQAMLSADNTVTPSFVADMEGVYVASLIVSDGKLKSTAVTTAVTAVPRIAAALGISLTDNYNNFCGISGTFMLTTMSGSSTWTINNCQVFGNAGALLRARIQNNGNSALTLKSIHVMAGNFGHAWNINPSSQTIAPQGTLDFDLPLWMSLEVTNAVATFAIDGEPDLVVPLKGNMILP